MPPRPLPKKTRKSLPGEALNSVVSTKLFPPRDAGRIFAREHLIARLMEARRFRCISLQGPAGYGKTTTIAAWRRELLTLGFDVAWLTLAPDDNEVSRWLDYLLASFSQVDPAITREAAQLAGRGVDSEAVERTLIALVRSIASRPREIMLVLDDVHLLTDAASHWALQWLLDQAPENLHLVLVSRGAAPVSLSRLRDQKRVFELDFQDLRFSQLETEAFLKAQLGELDRRDAQRLHELTDGWVAGLQLLSIDWGKRRDTAETKAAIRGQIQDQRTFGAYFEREILSRLSKDELSLLEMASICSRFCASLCAALLGRSDDAGDVSSLLTQLVARNVFIMPMETSERETWYRLHPLLGETIRARFTQRKETEQRSVHERAWIWFRDHGHVDEAIRHAVRAGKAPAAADLLEQCGQDLFSRGELRKLIGLVRRLPEKEVQSRTMLRLWMARSQLFARELDACAASLERLQADLPRDNPSAQFTLTLLKATLAVQRDDTDGAMLILPDLLQPPGGIEPAAIGGRNNILSWLYMHRGDYEQARRVQFDAPRQIVESGPLLGTPAGSLQGRCLVGLSYALEGQVMQAERVYRDVLYEAEQCGPSCIDPAYLAAALLGEVLYELNDTPAALRLLEDRVDVLERVSIPDSVLRVLVVLSASHWIAGRHLDAFAYLDRLEEYALHLGLDRLLAYSLGEQIHRHLQHDEYEPAKSKLARIAAIEARYPPKSHSASGEIFLIAQRAHIRWDLAVGDYDDAAARLAPLLSASEARGHQQIVATLLLQSAIVDQRCGQRDQAREKALAALRLGHRLGLVRSLLDADPSALDLIRSLSEEEGFDILLGFYVERLCAAQSPPPRGERAQPVADGASNPGHHEALSDREVDVVRLLAQALPNKKIARTLGLSPETVKWHLKNIYGKLGVAGRDDAVARMRDLGWGTGTASSSTI